MSNRFSIKSSEDYFSLDDISASTERIPCKFEVPVYHLGYLDPSTESDDLQPGTKLELPLWLASALCSRRRHVVSIELPKVYKEPQREVLNADATVVDLHKLGPYFYASGTRLLQFDHPESLDIAKMLLQTFQDRFRQIMDSSQNTLNEDTSSLTSRLDEAERLVFVAGQRGLQDFHRWETRQTDQLRTADMVVKHRKRKRAQMEADTLQTS